MLQSDLLMLQGDLLMLQPDLLELSIHLVYVMTLSKVMSYENDKNICYICYIYNG